MLEAQWLTSDCAQRMLAWVTCAGPSGSAEADLERRRKRPSGRKLRLYAVAVSRACCGGSPMPPGVPDRFLELAQDWAEAAADSPVTPPGCVPGLWVSASPVTPPGWVPGLWVSAADPLSAARQAADSLPRVPLAAALLRDIVGNPFHPVGLCGVTEGLTKTEPVPQCAACAAILDWNGGTVPRLAQAIYEERRWEDMPILADALSDAGCTDEAILRHCRNQERCWWCKDGFVEGAEGPMGKKELLACECQQTGGWVPLRGPHVRGNWVIDLLTGRE